MGMDSSKEPSSVFMEIEMDSGNMESFITLLVLVVKIEARFRVFLRVLALTEKE